MHVALFSVVYPGVEAYLPEFFGSLSNQTAQEFTLLLLNDGVPNFDLFLEKYNRPFRVRERSGSIARMRIEGIRWAIDEGADIIVFADADDWFETNRVEVSTQILGDSDIVFNELVLVGTHISRPVPLLSKRFREGAVLAAKDIEGMNCLGLSNTALRADRIPDEMSQIPDHILAFDWALFSLCLNAGARAVFTQATRTYYRQHERNVFSPFSFSDERILQGVRIKRDHYGLVSRFYEGYEKLAEHFAQALSLMESDESMKKRYCEAVRSESPPYPLWWEPFKPLGEFGL